MTAVRQKFQQSPKSQKRTPAASKASVTSSVVQVRLQRDEIDELRTAMQLLDLASRSEALRAGIRLLVREAREIAGADEIRRFYAGQLAPLPVGVATATAEELAAADSEQW